MKVFLVYASGYAPETERSMPLGILYLAAYLRHHHGCTVRLFDMQLRIQSPAPVVAAAREFGPDLIGISGMTPDAPALEALAAALKTALPGVPLLIGGPHATHYPQELLARTAADYLVIHEGETALGGFVEYLRGDRPLADVPNLVFSRHGEFAHTNAAPYLDDLDALPFPAYDLLDLEAYYRLPRCGVIYRHRRYAAIVTSRGCPYRCAYCHQVHGKRWRARSAANVAEEMADLVRRFGIGDFVIMDDLFNASEARLRQLAEAILERGLKIGLSFPIGLRGDLMTEDGVRWLQRAGMFRCMYAVETASPRLQELIGKNNNLEKLRHIIEFTRAQGVMVHGSFMLGFPTEVEAEARATVDWAVASALHTAAFYRVIPFRGTELYRLAKEAGARLIDDPKTYEFHKANVVNVSRIPDGALNRLKRAAYRRFYLSPRRLWAIWRALPNRFRLLPGLFAIWIRKAFLW
ncbi:MAG: B12-binding domain-containing radical SAM protein [Myxococcales bacterium]|nr:B12-binding domain-containing radical SAM protein [Myxococcales bacterium]